MRELSARHGAFVVDLERHAVASDPRLWDVDRLHANPEGHRRIAAAAAHALGLPDADEAWSAAFPDPLAAAPPLPRRVGGNYFTPWLIRRLRGRSSGDGRVAKRPELEPVRSL